MAQAMDQSANTNPDGNIRIILLGKTGCGKSSVGNTILGKREFSVDAGFQSQFRWQLHSRGGTEVEIVDTPGLFDPGTSLESNAEHLVRVIQESMPGPHAVLFVISIAQRFTEEDYRVYRCLKELFGSEISKFMIILFTGGDLLERDGSSIEKLLETAPARLCEIMEECENRYIVFDNTGPDRQTQVRALLGMCRSMMKRNQRTFFQTPYHHLPKNSQTAEVKKRLKIFLTSELQAGEASIAKKKDTIGREAEKWHVKTPANYECDDLMDITLRLLLSCAYHFIFDKDEFSDDK